MVPSHEVSSGRHTGNGLDGEVSLSSSGDHFYHGGGRIHLPTGSSEDPATHDFKVQICSLYTGKQVMGLGILRRGEPQARFQPHYGGCIRWSLLSAVSNTATELSGKDYMWALAEMRHSHVHMPLLLWVIGFVHWNSFCLGAAAVKGEAKTKTNTKLGAWQRLGCAHGIGRYRINSPALHPALGASLLFMIPS